MRVIYRQENKTEHPGRLSSDKDSDIVINIIFKKRNDAHGTVGK